MVGGMTAAPFPTFLTKTEKLAWPMKGRMHLTSGDGIIETIIKSGNSPAKTLPEGMIGPPGGICWRPRCCASDAEAGSESGGDKDGEQWNGSWHD
jgi:hypothetical protein